MTQTRKEALEELLAKVESGGIEHYHWSVLGTAMPERTWSATKSAYHGSLDAAKALHEAVLPRHYAQVHMWPMPEMCRVDIGGGHTGRDNDPARAWLIAILKALIAQEPDQ